MPPNRIFYTAYRQYRSSADFILNPLRAPYKTCNSYRVNSFYSFFTYCLSNSIYIGEKKGTVPITTFSGPSVAYNLNCSRYCFRYYFRYCFRCCFRRYFRRCLSPYTARINPAATTSINLVATFYGPPYCEVARLWSYYRPPYYGAARS